jgi:hypothetical protein
VPPPTVADVLQDPPAAAILEAFRPFLESEAAPKIWHNYGFDRHVLSNKGVALGGFAGDTMHMARWVARRAVVGLAAGLRGGREAGWQEEEDEEEEGGRRRWRRSLRVRARPGPYPRPRPSPAAGTLPFATHTPPPSAGWPPTARARAPRTTRWRA